MQRAFTARSESAARQTPLWAGFGKLALSLIVVLPGLAAYRAFPALGHTRRFDQALPLLMLSVYGPVMLGFGLTALVASLMSGLASNVSAFAALFTQDLYRTYLRTTCPETHYLRVGRGSTVAAILLCMLASYLNFFFSSLMEHVQLIFSIFGAPFWAIFLLGMGTRRATGAGSHRRLSRRHIRRAAAPPRRNPGLAPLRQPDERQLPCRHVRLLHRACCRLDGQLGAVAQAPLHRPPPDSSSIGAPDSAATVTVCCGCSRFFSSARAST